MRLLRWRSDPRSASARWRCCADIRDRYSSRAGADKRRCADGEARKTGVAYANRGGRRAIRHDSTLNVREQIMAYHLEGRLLEVCNCRVLCPCWIGEDPDFGTCDTIVSWHFDKGVINGVDVAGHTIALIAHIPGNILEGNWRAAVYLDDKVSAKQEEAILGVFTGKLGGPVADLAKLIGEVVSVEKVPIQWDVQGGKGVVKVGNAGYAELEPYKSASGATTTLQD